MQGYIGISREITDHWIYKDSQYFHVWFEMLRCARYSKEPKNDIEAGVSYTINYAEFIFGYPSWSKRLKVGEQRLRTLVKLLVKDRMIVQIKKHPKFTIYFIVNYEKYNNLTNNQQCQQTSTIEGDVNNLTNKQPTTSQQPSNNLLTTKEQRIIKNNQNNKETYTTEFELFYSEYPRPEDKHRSFTNWKTNLKNYTADQLITAGRNYKIAKVGTDKQYLKSSANFLGKEKPFIDYIAFKAETGKSKYRDLSNYQPGD